MPKLAFPLRIVARSQCLGKYAMSTNPLIAGLAPLARSGERDISSLQGGGVEQVYHNSMSIDVNWKDAR